MAETGDVNVTPEWRLVTIGRGSFASVSVLTGHPIAFKHVILPQRSQELRREFNILRSIYDSCDTDSFFAIPQPFAFYDPSVPASFAAPPRSPYSTIRRRPLRPRVTEGDFKMLNLDTAAYAMDHVSPLSLVVADTVRKLFYPPNSSAARPPSLCRVYFGKVISKVGKDGRPNRFFNSANFPLDVERYRMIKELDHANECGYPDVQEIAFGMGEMLGRLHWRAGYDARDVEFVMGGASFSGVALFVIDFNQMRTWKRIKEEIPTLVEAFFINDPYYPRPDPNDPLYVQFKTGYLIVYPQDATDLGEAFLHAIEAEQLRRYHISSTS